MNRTLLIIAILLFSVGIFFLLIDRRPEPEPPTLHTDTVYIDRFFSDTITIERVKVIPKTVRIYLPDTARRKRAESDTIITGVRLKGNSLNIERIAPKGTVLVATYTLPEVSPQSIEIDSRGGVSVHSATKTEKRKRFFRRIGTISVATIGLVGLVLLAK